MKKINNHIHVKNSGIVCCVLAVLLLASPCSATTVEKGDTLYVDGVVNDYLLVEGTANLLSGADVFGVWVQPGGIVNLYPGAYVLDAMYVEPSSVVNIHGGGVGYGIWLFYDNTMQPNVTIYGKYFIVDGYLYSANEFIPEPDGGSELTGLYENDDPIYLEFYGSVLVHLIRSGIEVMKVVIDVKPGSDTNPINLKSKGVVPVAVLTTGGFNAAQVNPATVQFAGAAMLRWTLEDVDGDGDKDMLLHFRTEQLNLDQNSTEATLKGQTTEEVAFEATDKVQIVPVKK